MDEGRPSSSADSPGAIKWLPPEPPGPDPVVGPPPNRPSPAPGVATQPASSPPLASPQGNPGWPPPPPAWPPGNPGWPPPPPAWPPPGFWVPPPSVPGPPGNDAAVAAFILGISALSILVFTFGFLFVISLPCAVVAIFLGRSGKRKYDRGDTPKHRGLAQAGFVMGIVGTVLTLLAAAGWIALFLSGGFDEGFDGFDDPQPVALGLAATVRAAVAGLV